jgi:hypothetical protein
MNNTLDLDLLIPEERHVKVNGKLWRVLPMKLTGFIKLQKMLRDIRAGSKGEDEMLGMMGELFDSMRPAVPEIDEMDLNMTQAFALLEFIYRQENKDNRQSGEKKTEISPT